MINRPTRRPAIWPYHPFHKGAIMFPTSPFCAIHALFGRIRNAGVPAFGRFSREANGSATVELVIVLPLLLWALAATVVFYDGYRTRYHAQMAAQTVADIMSRETSMFTADYVEGMNTVFDYLVDSRVPTRIRVSSVIWDSVNERNRLQWSYGTRDLSALPSNTFELLQSGDTESLLALFGEDQTFSFTGATNQMPVEDLASRIPPVLPGEALLVVESFALWTPFTNVGLGLTRFNPVVVVRPRFAPWINFEGVDTVFPEASYEIAWTGGANDSLPDPNDPVDPDPDPDPVPTPSVQNFDFEAGVTTGWSQSTVASGGPTGRFLGPFGRNTFATPVNLAVDLGTPTDTATIAFDLFILDDWKGFDDKYPGSVPGDTLTIMINGTPISIEGFKKDAKESYGRARASVVTVNGATYRVNMTLDRTQNFYGRGDKDQLWRVVITAENAPQTFTLGFSARMEKDVDRVSFGIDNLRTSATGDGSGATAAPIPDPATLTGTDPFTRFPQYNGCPDPSLPAQWLTMDVADLGDKIELERQAGGQTNVANCSDFDGVGYMSASPDLVLNLRRDASSSNNRLQIELDDDNDGRTCDTTLLVLDPNGQWWFNDDFDKRDAGLRLGQAPEGIYYIWVGNYNPGTCVSELTIEKQ